MCTAMDWLCTRAPPTGRHVSDDLVARDPGGPQLVAGDHPALPIAYVAHGRTACVGARPGCVGD